MDLIVNGQTRQLADSATVADLLADLGKAHTPAAVEVNRQVVPRRRHAEHVLEDGDQVEVVTLVGGG
jgi:sulfur carrier protein